jgi:hypothetical protein
MAEKRILKTRSDCRKIHINNQVWQYKVANFRWGCCEKDGASYLLITYSPNESRKENKVKCTSFPAPKDVKAYILKNLV